MDKQFTPDLKLKTVKYYNKDYYKNKQNEKKYTRRRTLKVYKD